jgi:hypothetical protein
MFGRTFEELGSSMMTSDRAFLLDFIGGGIDYIDGVRLVAEDIDSGRRQTQPYKNNPEVSDTSTFHE